MLAGAVRVDEPQGLLAVPAHDDGVGHLVLLERLERQVQVHRVVYSRLDAESPVATDVNVGALVQGILKKRSLLIAERGVEVTVAMPPFTVRAWERGLAQGLANLIDNALKYRRNATPPRVSIAGEALTDRYRIVVADNGIGFDMKYHDRIFGLFNRLVRAEEFEGTWAGLEIVKKALEKQGGTIRAESEPGRGARFFVELPKPRAGEAA
jgi:light-regulated signal transduction histidine kinase (bacteriophytochrome)